MPRRALIEKRPWLLASLALGVSYIFVKDSQVPGLFLLAWKGLPVALLAVWALLRHAGTDSRMLAGVMAFGAAGDVGIEFDQQLGALLFFCGHILAIALYLRHRRETPTASQKAFGVALLLGVPLLGYLLPADRAMAVPTALYGLALGGMAASAWLSSFSRYRVGMGAVLFVASDLLIFAQLGPLARSSLAGLTIWPLYYFGQVLIATGVVGTLRSRSGRG